MRGPVLKRLITALALAAAAVLICASGILYRIDNAACDAMYQQTKGANKDIVIFGIDQETIEALGPVEDLRGAMAQVIEILNADEASRPAVIGIDIMYTGEHAYDAEADRLLAEAAGKYPNVVVAEDIRFGTAMSYGHDGTYRVAAGSVLGLYEPYEALKQAADSGFVNEMMDKDGIFRHAMLYADIPERGRIYSFASVIYQKWAASQQAPEDLVPSVSAAGFYYLPFSQKAEGYDDGMSLLDLYNGEVDPYFYRDKIVLIGAVYAGSQDSYANSLDHAERMPGVAIQANIIEAFQHGFFPKEAGKYLQLAIVFVISFLLGIFLYDRKAVVSAICWFVLCALWLLACWLLYNKAGVILHVLWVPAAVSLAFLVSAALDLTRSQRDRRQIRETFGHYIDPSVMNELLAAGPDALELGGVTRDIAVLFVDVRGFTAMSEMLDAQTVVEIVNRYLTLTTDCIMNNHGTLDKFVGDCTMAVWNAPCEQEDPVYMACRAAMDMIDASGELGEELKREYGQNVSFGIGVNWGPAVVGNIGAPKRLDYTAIGDTVNTAARLEANAPGGTVLISRAVADALGERANVESLGSSIRLKGKSEDFEVLKLKELK